MVEMIDVTDQFVDSTPRDVGPSRQIDDVDLSLIKSLVANGRISLTDLAEQANVSRSTVHARVQRLRDDNVITGFTATVAPSALGLGVAALVFVDIDQHDWRSLRDAMMAIAGVEYLAMCAGRFDMMMLVRATSIDAFRDVLLQQVQRISGVRSTETIFILDEARR